MLKSVKVWYISKFLPAKSLKSKMPDLRVRLPGSYPLLLACIIQRLDWGAKYEDAENKLSIRDGEIHNPEIKQQISESIQYFLNNYTYSRENVEQVFDCKIVFITIRSDRKVSNLEIFIHIKIFGVWN